MQKRVWLLLALGLGGLLIWWMRSEAPSPTNTIDRKFAPSDWAYMQRHFPYWQADPAVYLKAMRHIEQMQLARLGKTSTWADAPWSFIGPTNIGGRITDIEFDPMRPDTVYAGAATGGVFKSIDRGKTWNPIFDDQPNLSVGDIGIDPQNPDQIYVGTGEANGGHNNHAGGGVYKSRDGGKSWAYKGLVNTVSIGRVIVEPQNPSRVFVAAVGSYFAPNPDRGVFRSTDGGDSWKKVLFVSDSTGCVDLVQHPKNPNILYAAMWERVRRPQFGTHLNGPTSGIYKTTDGGDSWTKLANGLPSGSNIGRIGLTISASNPNILYALYNNGSTPLGIYKTLNDGEAWTKVDVANTFSQGASDFSWYFGQIRVHPTKPDLVYALDVNLMRSTDGGGSFGFVSGGNMHVDHHAFAFHPKNPDLILEGNDGGINGSDDGGQNWWKAAALPVTQFYEIGLNPADPLQFFGGTQDNGTIRTLTGKANDWQNILGGDGFHVIIDPTDPLTIYAESQNGAMVRIQNGFTQNATNGIPSSDPKNWNTPIAIDPQEPGTVYYGTNKLYRSTNRAVSWASISPILTNSPAGARTGTISTISVSPSNSNVLYVGTDDSQVQVTKDGGTTWKEVSSTLPFRWVTRIAIHPTEAQTALVSFSGLKWKDPQSHLFRTRNYGESWEDISGSLPDLPINVVSIDPVNPDIYYVGTDLGAFVSMDAAKTWQPLGAALPLTPVYDFEFNTDGKGRFLVAGTHGRGMYKLYLGNPIVANDTETPPQSPSLHIYPNPLSNEGTIALDLPALRHVRLEVFDLQGRRQSLVLDTPLAAGQHRRSFSTPALPNGTYILSLTWGTKRLVKKFVVTR